MNKLIIKSPWKCPLCEASIIGGEYKEYTASSWFGDGINKHLRLQHRLVVNGWTFESEEDFTNQLIKAAIFNTFMP